MSSTLLKAISTVETMFSEIENLGTTYHSQLNDIDKLLPSFGNTHIIAYKILLTASYNDLLGKLTQAQSIIISLPKYLNPSTLNTMKNVLINMPTVDLYIMGATDLNNSYDRSADVSNSFQQITKNLLTINTTNHQAISNASLSAALINNKSVYALAKLNSILKYFSKAKNSGSCMQYLPSLLETLSTYIVIFVSRLITLNSRINALNVKISVRQYVSTNNTISVIPSIPSISDITATAVLGATPTNAQLVTEFSQLNTNHINLIQYMNNVSSLLVDSSLPGSWKAIIDATNSRFGNINDTASLIENLVELDLVLSSITAYYNSLVWNGYGYLSTWASYAPYNKPPSSFINNYSGALFVNYTSVFQNNFRPITFPSMYYAACDCTDAIISSNPLTPTFLPNSNLFSIQTNQFTPVLNVLAGYNISANASSLSFVSPSTIINYVGNFYDSYTMFQNNIVSLRTNVNALFSLMPTFINFNVGFIVLSTNEAKSLTNLQLPLNSTYNSMLTLFTQYMAQKNISGTIQNFAIYYYSNNRTSGGHNIGPGIVVRTVISETLLSLLKIVPINNYNTSANLGLKVFIN